MLTRIDHVMICVPDLERGIDAYTRIGFFQVLYRTSSMGAAARFMADHGVPPPAGGIRNTGEQAMLVGPEHAGGAYIGFVGPE